MSNTGQSLSFLYSSQHIFSNYRNGREIFFIGTTEDNLWNVTPDHKNSQKGPFFRNWDLYIIWKLNK